MNQTAAVSPLTQYSSSSQSTESRPTEKSQRQRGLMKGHYLENCITSCTLVLPMLIVSIVLVSLAYTHLMADESSTYSHNGHANITLGSSYYVNYPATQLVFFSSVSSTLAPLLFSPILALFSYFAAYRMTKESDSLQVKKLASPFQLVLIIQTLDAKILSLWSTLTYAFSSKKKRVAVVPNLRKAAVMLCGILFLGVLIVLADIWLHIATDSVQYVQKQPMTTTSGFLPSRAFSEDCLSVNYTVPRYERIDATKCNFVRGTVESAMPVLKNHAEVMRTIDDQSDANKLLEIDGVTVLGPALSPSQIDHTAASFGSHSTCEIITDKCSHKRQFDNRIGDDVSFGCGKESSGADYWGVFSGIDSKFQYLKGFGNKTLRDDMTLAPSRSYTYNIQVGYYTDEFYSFENATWDAPGFPWEPQLRWIVGFVLPPVFQGSTTKDLELFRLYEGLGLLEVAGGNMGGIAKCSTNLTYVDYQNRNGTTSIHNTSLLDRAAPVVFSLAMHYGFGFEDLHRGIQIASARSTSRQTFADGIARAYDRMVVSLGASVAVAQAPKSMSRYKTTLVSRVPLAPFWAVVALNMVYALIGIALTVVALCVIGLGQGVSDARARLSLEAVTAESFENPMFAEDAKNVKDLFAERRGLPVRRIALIRRSRGARRYKQIVQASRHPPGFI